MGEDGDTYTPSYILLSLSAFAIAGNLTVILMVSNLTLLVSTFSAHCIHIVSTLKVTCIMYHSQSPLLDYSYYVLCITKLMNISETSVAVSQNIPPKLVSGFVTVLGSEEELR